MERSIVAVGDSITYGVADSTGLGWFNRLRSESEKRECYDAYYNLGVCSETSTSMLMRLEKELKVRKPDIILIAIGINDTRFIGKDKKECVNKNQFQKNILKIDRIASKYTQRIIYIGLTRVAEKKTNPIQYSRMYWYNNDRIIEYEDVIKRICRQTRRRFVNLANSFESSWLDEDGLHPNARGHVNMAKIIKLKLVKYKII